MCFLRIDLPGIRSLPGLLLCCFYIIQFLIIYCHAIRFHIKLHSADDSFRWRNCESNFKVDEDELARSDYALHYYRLDGILLGSVEPIHGLTEEPAVDIPAHTMALQKSSVINGTADADTVTLNEGGELLTEAWMLFPGSYRVTLTGSGFDHSYIYARHGLINQETYKMEVNFTGIAPDEMVFEFSTGEPLYYWRTAVHALDDTPIAVTVIKVEKIG